MARIKIFLFAALIAIGLPITAAGQTKEEVTNFCRISQMLIPIFLEGGDISGESVCTAGGGTYQCTSSMSLGAGVCVAGGGTYQCTSSMSLGAGVCVAGGGTYQCTSSMRYGAGVCVAGGGTYECTSSMSLGTAVCIAGGNRSDQCSGISNDELGKGICQALGGQEHQCAGVSVSQAICGFTNNCKGTDAGSIASSMVETCGAAVLHFGID